MDPAIVEKARQLRQTLHLLAERSGQEKRTKACLLNYLQQNTTLQIEDYGQWFCALHFESERAETIAFRADMDALPLGSGAAHLCGHDGHSATLATLALLAEGQTLGRNLLLIFQHAEEIGVGGKICAKALKAHNASRVYAFHNIPEWPEGAVLLRHGTFACASRGMCVAFKGAPSHAAYPENGRNPGFAAAHFISALPAIAAPGLYGGLAMATLVGAKIGEKAFGSAAGEAEVWLTLRAWENQDLAALMGRLEAAAHAEAKSSTVTADIFYEDIFPATINDEQTLRRLADICGREGLPCLEVPEPFRWSEDFGYYGSHAKAVMVGLGAGEHWPQLHTEAYCFNDALLGPALQLFWALATQG